jgi:hypothetical protein
VFISDADRERWRREIASENAWGSEAPRRWVELGAAIAVAAVVLDALLTYVLLGDSVSLEANPLVGEVMRTIGIAPTLTVGALLRFGIVAALAFIATRAVRPIVRYLAAATIAFVALWWCAVVFSNAVVAGHIV